MRPHVREAFTNARVFLVAIRFVITTLTTLFSNYSGLLLSLPVANYRLLTVAERRLLTSCQFAPLLFRYQC